MNKIKKIFIFIFVFILSITLIGCKKDDDNDNNKQNEEIDWTSKRVASIDPIEEYQDFSFEYDEFSLDKIKFMVTYTDGTSREVSLEASMLDEKDLNKLEKAGNPRIYITYEWNNEIFGMNYIVHLVDSALLDQDLNRDGSHGAVVKAIRDLNQNKINFILEKSEGVKALQFKYTCNKDIMTISNAIANSSLKGIFDFEVKDDYVIATIILDDVLTEETTLFSLDFSGNFRTSGLKCDTTFDNQVYGIDDELQPVRLENVIYHASIK